MVDFKKHLGEPRPPSFDWHYRCKACGEEVVFISQTPSWLMRHGFNQRDKCRGELEFVEKVEVKR